jgi:DNA-binding IclR family transcriptional regulator
MECLNQFNQFGYYIICFLFTKNLFADKIIIRVTMNELTKNSKYSVPALEKGLDILEQLAQASAPLSLTQLAQQMGRTSNEIYRMLTCLEERGYIVREAPSSNYSLTLRLYQLAHTHSPVEKLLAAARLPMEKLALETDESCHVCMLNHGQTTVIWQELNQGSVRISVVVGGCYSVVSTVSGRLLLAYLPDHERLATLAENEEYQCMTPEARRFFNAQLEEIIRAGYSYAENESMVGLRDYAVLLGSPQVGLAASLAIPSLTRAKHPKSKDELLAALLRTAATINRNAGFAL